jgi:hypothetical protein
MINEVGFDTGFRIDYATYIERSIRYESGTSRFCQNELDVK